MWKGFVDLVFRFESLRIGVLLLMSRFFGLCQYLHLLPEAFFTSRTYGFIQVCLNIILSFFIIYAFNKYLHKRNMDRLKKDMEELTHSDQKSTETTKETIN